MEARFIVLHPDDPGEILLSSVLIRCLKAQVEGAQVYSLVKGSHAWLLESNPFLDDIFRYQDHPREQLDQLRDFLPDYLIDLDGRREVRRFKNRLKVLDFTINKRNLHDQWTERSLETCRLFDVHDDGKGLQFFPAALDQELLPSEFMDGYIVLSLESDMKVRPLTDSDIISMAVMTEKPIVITGSAADRALADRISQSTGCAVFPTCGDLSNSENGSVLSRAKGAIIFHPFWIRVASALGIERQFIDENRNPTEMKDIALWGRSLFNKGHDRNVV